MADKIWSAVGVAMQSALATALPISGITKANPAVVSYTGTDPANGDYVYLSDVVGMTQLNKRVVRVANVNGAGNTFEAEGIDSTLFDTFVSGNAQVITFGTTIDIMLNAQGSGGEAEQVDVTTIHDAQRQSIPGLFSASQFTGSCKYDPSKAGFRALKSASELKAIRAFRFTWPDGSKYLFSGRVGFLGAPGGSAQGIVESPLTITVDGFGTDYTT